MRASFCFNTSSMLFMVAPVRQLRQARSAPQQPLSAGRVSGAAGGSQITKGIGPAASSQAFAAAFEFRSCTPFCSAHFTPQLCF
jgi:hypothetical protein